RSSQLRNYAGVVRVGPGPGRVNEPAPRSFSAGARREVPVVLRVQAPATGLERDRGPLDLGVEAAQPGGVLPADLVVLGRPEVGRAAVGVRHEDPAPPV